MAEVEVGWQQQLRLANKLPVRVWHQVRNVRRDRCKFIITMIARGYDRYTASPLRMRDIEFPESWGLSSDAAVSFILLNAWPD